MECLACHAPNNDGARFCAKCGAPLPTKKEADADPLIGKNVGGRYRITGILGEGGMGRVYTGEQQMGTSVRKVAVKTLLSQFAKDEQTVARFMREVGTVSELEHPNTIKVYDFGKIEESGELYIAMEMLSGQSLDDAIAGGTALSPERADKILGQACGSLQEAHDKGVVHRDLKPANIFLTTRAGEEDYVKVLDFGIAKKASSKDSKQEQKLTQQGTILGTPPYMSPEQFTGKELDARSDLYSLAIVAYEMLTGRLPFEAETPWEWMTQHMSGQPFPFESTPAGANVPHKMKQAILRALSKEPSQRPSTAREFFEELTLGETRMSVLGLGAAGVAAVPRPPGTAMLQTPSARGGSTQIGEPIPMAAPGGAGKTQAGTAAGGMTPYGAQPAVPTGGGQAYPAPPPVQQKKGGSSVGLIVAALVLVGGGVGGFFFWKSKQAADGDDIPTIAINDDKGKGKGKGGKSGDDGEGTTAATTGGATDATTSSSTGSGDTADAGTEPTASATTSASAAPTASASATTSAAPTASATTTTTATATGVVKPQGIDACCASALPGPKKKLCNSINAGIKNGSINRAGGLNTLRSQGIRCN